MKIQASLLAVLLLAPLASAGAGEPSRGSLEYVPRIYEILSADWNTGTSERQRLTRLVELGPDAIPSFCAILTGAAEPADSEDGAPKLVRNPGVHQENELLLQALRQMPAKAVLQFLGTIVEVEMPVGYRLVAMRILAGTADREAVRLWVRLLEPLDPIHLLRAYVQAPAEAALADILCADSYAYRDLMDSLDKISRPIHPLIARAIGTAGRPEGLDVLERMLGEDPELDLIVLDQVSKVGEGAPVWRLHGLVGAIRDHLDDPDWRMRRASAVALSQLHDVDSFPRLLELLEDDYRRVRQGALWGLQAMSEMRWGVEEVDQWGAWFDAQYAWWQENRDHFESELMSRDPGHVLAAIKALGERRLFKHQVAEMIATVVDHPRESIAGTACATLGRLGSRRVVPDLVRALERSDEGVREAATRALRTLTGQKLPADAEAWAEFLRE